jgi:hypothetical protein
MNSLLKLVKIRIYALVNLKYMRLYILLFLSKKKNTALKHVLKLLESGNTITVSTTFPYPIIESRISLGQLPSCCFCLPDKLIIFCLVLVRDVQQ